MRRIFTLTIFFSVTLVLVFAFLKIIYAQEIEEPIIDEVIEIPVENITHRDPLKLGSVEIEKPQKKYLIKTDLGNLYSDLYQFIPNSDCITLEDLTIVCGSFQIALNK